MLAGIRYDLIERALRRSGIPFELRPVAEKEVLAADEMLVSSATKEVLPVTTLDGAASACGAAGAGLTALYEGYGRRVAEWT